MNSLWNRNRKLTWLLIVFMQSGISVCFATPPIGVKPLSARGGGVRSGVIIPWIEVNNPRMLLSELNADVFANDSRTTLQEHALEGLALWGRVANTVIVTTTLGRAEALYQDLMKDKPSHLQIIGGVKTYILPGARPKDKRPYDFADAEGWRRIAESAARIAEITGTRRIVLENETALAPFHTGRGTIDYQRLRRALTPLRESGIQIWWALPAILEDTRRAPDRRRQTARLVEVVAEAVPDSVFMPAYVAWRDWKEDRDRVTRRRLMIESVGRTRLHEMLYVAPDGVVHQSRSKTRRGYTPDEAMSRIEELVGDAFVIYPGAVNWVSVAGEFARLGSHAVDDAAPDSRTMTHDR